ncbi:hypothetical protein AB0368_30070 [Actinoplanes sp. NPDC051475]|uniref:hypothetical protein n=1 Tax=Actinoplanes sp. NPDC051475 TaxID=3157225 RepID=UPI00344B919E
MAVRIRNLAVAGPLYVRLTSGRSVRLSPGGATEELEDVEIAGNAKIDRLRESGLIDVEQIPEDRPAAEQAEDQQHEPEEQADEKPAPRRTARGQK